MFRLSAVAVLGCSATGITDEITLLQAIPRSKEIHRRHDNTEEEVHHPDKTAVSTLLESVGSMLKNGATPDVVEFAQASISEITGAVIPAIGNASATDQEYVYATFAQFEVILADLEEGTFEVHARNEEERRHSTAHKSCRDVEEQFCTAKTTCDYNLY